MPRRGLCVLCVAFLLASTASAQDAGLRGREILVLSPMEPTRPAVAAFDATRDCREGARTITVSTFAERGNSVVLEVRDTGPGVSSEQLPHLFDHSKQDGLGVGLAISKSIMQALDGKVEAGNWQHGAIFKISMPVAAVAAAQVADHAAV